MSLRIKELRTGKGWTQQDLADRANISRSQLTLIENGTRPANTLRLEAIAKALGVSTNELFSRGEEDHLVLLIRALPPEDREALVRMAEALAAQRSTS